MSQPTIAQFPCPCCSSHEISEVGGYEICSICGWEDDPVQSRYPELAGGANKVSLNQARSIWLERQSLNLRTTEEPITARLDSRNLTTERLSRLLQQLAADLRFSKVAATAIKLVGDYGAPIEIGDMSGETDPSKYYAELWAFRRRIGYYDPTRVLGVDETIDALLAADCPVSLVSVEVDGCVIAVWLNTQSQPVGLIVIKPSAIKKTE